MSQTSASWVAVKCSHESITGRPDQTKEGRPFSHCSGSMQSLMSFSKVAEAA